jgi:hypothetical protein
VARGCGVYHADPLLQKLRLLLLMLLGDTLHAAQQMKARVGSVNFDINREAETRHELPARSRPWTCGSKL